MTTNPMHREPGRGWDDEQLLEWILNPESAAPRAHAAGPTDPTACARMEDLTGFLSQCRRVLVDEPVQQGGQSQEGGQSQQGGQSGASERDAALTARVFACTTREDLSWRGDLTLVGGYVRERLSRSVVLRFAAASLLLHMAALPVLAYYVFLAPTTPELHIDVIPHAEQYPAPPFPEDEAFPVQPGSPLEVDLDEEPAVREGRSRSGDER